MKTLILLITIITSTSLIEANEIIPIWNNSIAGGDIQDMEILPGGNQALILAGVVDSKFFFIDTENGETIREVLTKYFVHANFELTKDSSRIIAVNGMNRIELRDLQTLALIDSAGIEELPGYPSWLSNTVIDPIRPIVYFTQVGVNTDSNPYRYKSKVIAYNYETMESLEDFTDFSDDVYSVLAISNDGKYLASINDGLKAYLKIWDLETNELIVSKPMFDKNSDEECFTRGLTFSDKEKSMVYMSGGYTININDDGKTSSVFSYNFEEDIRTSIAPDGIYTSGNLLLFDDEIRLVASVGGAIGVININESILEWYNKPPNNGYSTIFRYNKEKDHFLGASSTNDLSKFRYDRETSVEKEYGKEIIISPNPTNNFVNISIECIEPNINYSIYNTDGVMINQNMIENQQDNFIIDFSPYPTGVYFLSFMCNNQMKTYKVVKEG